MKRFDFVDFVRHVLVGPADPALVNLGDDAGCGIEFVCLMAVLIFAVYEDLWAGVEELVLGERNQAGAVVVFLEKTDFSIIEACSIGQRQAVNGTDE